MVPVPRFSNYRGLCFVNFDPAAESLESYLGNAREYLDLVIDLATLPTPGSTYALSVVRTGSGAGQVLSSPAGISCGATCSRTRAGCGRTAARS